jgi:CarD family transcriptional regulator
MDKGTEIQIGEGSLRVGDRVVYPNQGIYTLTGLEVKQIAGQSLEVVVLAREGVGGAKVMVPRNKVAGIGLRKLASEEQIEELFDYLAAPGEEPQLEWKFRHRENAARMTGGSLLGTARVLKELHALCRVRPLPQREREQYDSMRHLLVGEIAATCNLPAHVAEDNLDYSLFPPPGMTRKGRPLQAAMGLLVAAPLPAAGGDDLDGELEGDLEEDVGLDRAGLEEAVEETLGKPSAGARAAPTRKLRALAGIGAADEVSAEVVEEGAAGRGRHGRRVEKGRPSAPPRAPRPHTKVQPRAHAAKAARKPAGRPKAEEKARHKPKVAPQAKPKAGAKHEARARPDAKARHKPGQKPKADAKHRAKGKPRSKR